MNSGSLMASIASRCTSAIIPSHRDSITKIRHSPQHPPFRRYYDSTGVTLTASDSSTVLTTVHPFCFKISTSFAVLPKLYRHLYVSMNIPLPEKTVKSNNYFYPSGIIRLICWYYSGWTTCLYQTDHSILPPARDRGTS